MKPSAAALFCVVACALLPARLAAGAGFDTTTRGNWVGVYGRDGYILNDYNGGGGGTHSPVANTGNDLAQVPSYLAGYSYGGGAQSYVWETNIADVRAPQNPGNPAGGRNAATVYDHGPYSVDLVLNQPAAFRLGVYALDWDRFGPGGRDVNILVNNESVQVSNTTPSTDAYENGLWVVFDVNAAAASSVRIDVQQNNDLGNSNAVISAIMFDPIPEPGPVSLVAAALGLLIWRRRRCPA